MKFIAYFLAFNIIAATPIHASSVKDIYSNAEDQIHLYYENGGEWNVDKIKNMSLLFTESDEFVVVSAKVLLKKIRSGKNAEERCLVSIVRSQNEFQSINCFSN